MCHASFARHVASHESVVNCQYCSLTFNRKDSYQRHLKLHGNMERDAPAEVGNPEHQTEFEIDEGKLKTNLQNFQVHPPNIPLNSRTADFIHPFTCKVMGPRGSGKTSFTVSYIQQIACITFPKIYIVTASPDQPLYVPLKESTQIYFITLDELDAVLKSNKDILMVLDDMMKETRFSFIMETLYTRGRHQRISIISLEQDLFYSNHVERRNVDYFVLTRMRDTSCLQEFYKRFCRDVQQWRFIELYEMAVKPALGYIIIDFVCPHFKYRINSLNSYYCNKHNKMRYILGKTDDILTELNMKLKNRFQSSLLAIRNQNYKSKGITNEMTQHIDSDDEILECMPVNTKTLPILECTLPNNETLKCSLANDEPAKKTTQSLRCRYCNRRFHDESALDTHMEEHDDYL